MDVQPGEPLLQNVVCAAGVAADVGKLITAAQGRHWDVGVVATPQGLGFFDVEAVEAQTGHPCPLGLANTGPTAPNSACGRDRGRGRPGHLQHH